MSEVKVNKISPRTNCGTVTLGDSGDTITIPAGVTITNNGTQTGFGRTGTVNWDTTAKTAGFTGVSGNGYFINTTSGAITVNLPASPSAGDIMAVADYAGTSQTNAITIGRNGSNIEGGTDDASLDVNRESKTFVYVDGTQGWVVVNSNDESAIPNPFLVASGGTETTSGDYKIHTFTGPGCFTVSSVGATPANNIVSYLVVAGGGGGGAVVSGGGGAGGFREYKGPADCYTASPLNGNPGGTAITVIADSYPITVGGGGAGGTPPTTSNGGQGSNSVFSTVTSTGGGGSGNDNGSGQPGGSGGGRLRNTKGNGNTPPVSPPQGNPGGDGSAAGNHYAGGGGGATAAGGCGAAPASGGNGGAGATTSINGSPNSFSGGGGGSATVSTSQTGTGGNGGLGGGGAASFQGPTTPPARNGGAGFNPGGNGSTGNSQVGGAGGTNSGGGGGGGSHPSANGGAGGSGIVIIRYKFQ